MICFYVFDVYFNYGVKIIREWVIGFDFWDICNSMSKMFKNWEVVLIKLNMDKDLYI